LPLSESLHLLQGLAIGLTGVLDAVRRVILFVRGMLQINSASGKGVLYLTVDAHLEVELAEGKVLKILIAGEWLKFLRKDRRVIRAHSKREEVRDVSENGLTNRAR
jgi:hypothetical protein